MIKKIISCCIFILSPFLLSGCWDSTELNDRAIELGWGLDKAKNKKVEISTQVIIPSKIGAGQGNTAASGKGSPYFVETGIGKNTLEAVEQMQAKLSRKIFRGQRRVIVIGEPLARKGIKNVLDTYTRDASINLLTDIFVVKGDTAKHFLKTSYPLENIPAIGALKEYNQLGAKKEVGFLNFLLFAASEGRSPTMPVIKFGTKSEGFKIEGTGVFNKSLKLIGFLNVEESKAMRWVTENLGYTTVTTQMPKMENDISLDLNTVGSKIQPIFQKNRLKFLVTLTGQGVIRENNTDLDLTDVKNVALAQKALNKQAEKQVLNTITKVQKKYGTDIFGFSKAIQKKDLRKWKSIKKNWNEEFKNAEVAVNAHLIIRKIGVTGPSLIQ